MKVKTCRICLAMGENMTFLGNPIKDFIEGIFKSNGFSQDLNVQNYACFECKALLLKSYNFIQKTLRAQQTMYKILETQKVVGPQEDSKTTYEQNSLISIPALHSIDRVQLGLSSTLSHCRVEIDFFIEENENDIKNAIEDIDSKSNLIDLLDPSGIKIEIDEITYANSYTGDNITEEVESVIKTDHETNSPPTLFQFENNTKDCKSKGKESKKKCKGDLPLKLKGSRRNQNIKQKKKIRILKKEDSQSIEVPIEFEPPDKKVIIKLVKKRKQNSLKYPRKCDHCSYTIERANMHFKHYLFCHTTEEYPYLREAKFVCQICGVTKRSAQTLKQHELTHGEKTFHCDQCSAKFHNGDQLRRHKSRQHSSRQLICDYCNKVFKMKGDIVLHLRTHTGEKPFKCHICGAAFAHRGNIGIHIRSRHQNSGLESKKGETSKKVIENIN